LRKYRWDKATGINLQEKIAEEFQHCGLPEYQDCTERLLEQGKLLILFDGLDEVPTELLGQMTEAIKNLVDRYSKNRFIASCRIAAYRSFQNFSRFTDVAIANFDEPQIQCFIENWFKSHDRPEWGEECQKRLNSDDHKATRELAQTPLLLTLICILFLKRGEFPTKRATLYDKALTTLLEEWDASKEIVRQQPYKGLDTKYKEIMLAEIAYINFTNDNLFFQKGEISKQIEQVLKEMLTEEKQINGRDVLRAVEEQHGLLVNRYEDIYSFSHLTIQEFLTAKHIFDSNLDINHIVTDYLYKENWREVFLLLTGLKKADDLLLVIEQELIKYILRPKLQKLLEWVDEVTDDHIGIFRPVGKRAIAIAYAYGFTNANIYANAFADGYKQASTYGYAENTRVSYANGYGTAVAHGGYTTALNIANAHTNDYSVDTSIIYANGNNNANPITNINAHKYFIKYVDWVVKHNIYRGLDLSGVIDQLKNMESQIPGNADCQEVHQTFARQLIQIFLAAFHITPEMVDLSQDEIQILDNYLYGTKLLIECEHAAVRRTPEVWSQIEERLLRKAATTN
jgi:NACHT domain